MHSRRSIWREKDRCCMRGVGFWNMSNLTAFDGKRERATTFAFCLYICLFCCEERCAREASELLLLVPFLTLGISFSLPCPYVSEAFANFSNNHLRSASPSRCHCSLQRQESADSFAVLPTSYIVYVNSQVVVAAATSSLACLSHMHRSFPPCHKG